MMHLQVRLKDQEKELQKNFTEKERYIKLYLLDFCSILLEKVSCDFLPYYRNMQIEDE